MEKKGNLSGAVKNLIQFVKFNVVGIANTLVDFAVYTALTAVNVNIYVAQAVGYICGMVNSYIFNSRWTFREEHTRSVREIVLFIAVNIVSLCVGEAALYAARNVLGVQNDIVCKLISLPFSIGVNFIGNKLFVFKKSEEQARDGDTLNELPKDGREQ